MRINMAIQFDDQVPWFCDKLRHNKEPFGTLLKRLINCFSLETMFQVNVYVPFPEEFSCRQSCSTGKKIMAFYDF